MFRGKRVTLLWRDRTRNTGTATKSASHTGLQYKSTRWSRPVALRRIGLLGHNKANTGTKGWTSRFPAATFRFGRYPLRICADIGHKIPEKNEGNNCRSAGAFYVLPTFFWVRVRGAIDLFPGVKVLWDSGGAHGPIHYSFSRNLARGVFEWTPEGQLWTITYTVEGTDSSGCVWSGRLVTDAVDGPGSIITVNFLANRYTAHGALAGNQEITATQACPQGTVTRQIPS